MAYDANKDDHSPFGQHSAGINPYVDLAEPDPNAVAAPTSAPLANTGAAGAGGSGHVNFDQLYNANAGVSAREAGKLQTSAQQHGQAAQQGLTGAQQGFSSAVRTGTVQGPTQAQSDWAKSGATGVTQPKTATAAQVGDARTGQQGYVTEGQEGLVSTPPPAGSTTGAGSSGMKGGDPAAGKPVKGGTTPDQLLDPDWNAAQEAGVRAGAAGQYSGPGALSDLDQYAQLLKDATAAQDESSALASGNEGVGAVGGLNRLDASLLGAAGRPGFAALGRQYGSLGTQLDQANLASKTTADAARKQSEDDAAQYQGLLDEQQGRVGSDQAAADAANKHSDQVLGDAQTKHDNQERFNDYLHGGSGFDQFRNTLHGVARATDLTDNTGVASGGGIVTAATDAISPQSATNTGNESGVWATDEAAGKDDSAVWASMSDADWAEFASLTDEEKHAWIEARRKKLQGGG